MCYPVVDCGLKINKTVVYIFGVPLPILCCTHDNLTAIILLW